MVKSINNAPLQSLNPVSCYLELVLLKRIANSTLLAQIIKEVKRPKLKNRKPLGVTITRIVDFEYFIESAHPK